MATILITGGTSGIGLATAQLMHARGGRVAVTGRSRESVDAARALLPDDVVVTRSDAASLEDSRDLAASLAERFGALDAVVLNAGINRQQPLADVDEATFDELVAVNFKGQYFTLQSVLGLLRDGASIVFTVGTGVTSGVAGATVTSATRGALLAMVPSLALELAPRRIRVNAVSPGATDTPMWDKLQVPADARRQLADKIPLGRFGTAHEVAETIAFLASDAAAYITAQHLAVGGGAGLGS